MKTKIKHGLWWLLPFFTMWASAYLFDCIMDTHSDTHHWWHIPYFVTDSIIMAGSIMLAYFKTAKDYR